ncbi:hypothetical protein AB1Y20_017312 [Prymnesium parvum]|uniref:Transmembrane protein n=1 Tax=Prymnesium parvum TaxID=97485 RepID=A0AB34JLB4_PRYPA|mmetsp:Transcript_4838/g.11819  ORF Transcript_4838/g.11819 Transcript_4838/m.11819 type:complete len:396 (-) Transcript_4838:213-1400(-)
MVFGAASRVVRRSPPLRMMVHPVKQPFTTKDYLASTVARSMDADWISRGVPRWVTLLDEVLFVCSSAIFVEGSRDFFPDSPFPQYVEGCELFIVGSALNVALALFRAYETFVDAKLNGKPPAWADLAEQALYVLGSLLFLAGTILFTPPLGPYPSTDVSADSASRVLQVPWFGRTYALIVQGTELPEPPTNDIATGDIYFIAGSVLYSVAAFVSALRAAGESGGGSTDAVRRRTAVATGTLYQLGGVAFVIGTLGFIPDSVLGITACPGGKQNLEFMGAALFLVGSSAYFLGALLTLVVVAYLTYYNGPKLVRSEDVNDQIFGTPVGLISNFDDSTASDPEESEPARQEGDRAAGSPTYEEYAKRLKDDAQSSMSMDPSTLPSDPDEGSANLTSG